MGFKPRNGWDIPHPPRPKNDKVDPSAYIPNGMTKADREALREAGLEWTDTLGYAKGGLVGWVAESADSWNSGSGRNKFVRARKNIYHFQHGGGAPLELGEGEISDLQSQTKLFSGVEREFLKLIADDMKGCLIITQRHFVAMTGNGSSPNFGTAWFGAYAKEGTGWYYAMGGFLLGYGAMAIIKNGLIAIWYRSYVYDRYNWDLGKETTVPARNLSYLLNDSVMEQVAGKVAPDLNRYFRSVNEVADSAGDKAFVNQDPMNRDGEVNGYEVGEKYVAADALLGALEESGDAQRYNINGSGRIIHFSIPVEAKK